MTASKASVTAASHECCMCGDHGFPNELFQCKACRFRSQHRYCSNLYPNVAESLGICNWCLSQKDDKSQNSSNSSSSFKNDDDSTAIKTKKVKNGVQARSGIGPLKKQRSVEAPSGSGRKRIVTAAAKEAAENLRRTRSDDISRVGVTRHVFRNRVRRYKLLDEVSS